ncbi:MAG: RtcB family protein [Planctomycetes bacterium]|nr:RtcB family protein [Planctomycetota bacterium]
MDTKMHKVSDWLYEIPREGQMNVPGRIYADSKLADAMGLEKEEAPKQVANVACLPGIVNYSMAMPDIHWGYGFPIGGVAAFDHDSGVISPGGVGYDINCGVRLMRTNLFYNDIKDNIKNIVRNIFHAIPSGVGSSGAIPRLSSEEEHKLLKQGAKWAVENGYGSMDDLQSIEDYGAMPSADPETISKTAITRGLEQLGTLGSGNHFWELGKVAEIYDEKLATSFGIALDMITVLVHTGSRGFGYQICDDYVKKLIKASQKYQIFLPDRQLACAPFTSPEGQDYFAAMSCAANYAWANRQVIMALSEESLARSIGRSKADLGLKLVYDVCHNIAKVEEHIVDGKPRKLVVHRKGATRAFGPGQPLLPQLFRETGQPVLIPGDMGRCSYLCAGTQNAMMETFGSSCHGAGRVASRSQMIRNMRGQDLKKIMDELGVFVMAQTKDSMAEEMPSAYKDVSDVVDVMHRANISRKVARFVPLGVVKG